jgi:preprotein translocase subunit SecY
MFTPGTSGYMILFALMIIIFTFFWVANQFNPMQIADNLQKQSAYVPGVRPGQPTANFLDYTMTRLTAAGALFLAIIALLPQMMADAMNIPFVVASFFGGSSMLIMVGVILDTMKHIETHLLNQEYDGFLKKGRLRSRQSG